MKTIIIRRFDSYFSAHILKTRFEHSGIPCYLFDENTVTVNPAWSNAVGSIKLVVSELDYENAKNALAQFDAEYLSNSLCPKCITGNFIIVPEKSTGNFITTLLTWMFSNYAVSIKNIFQCSQCGYETESLPEQDILNHE